MGKVIAAVVKVVRRAAWQNRSTSAIKLVLLKKSGTLRVLNWLFAFNLSLGVRGDVSLVQLFMGDRRAHVGILIHFRVSVRGQRLAKT